MSGRLPEEDYSDWHAVDQDKPLSTCACVHCELGRAKQEIERLKAIVDCCSDLVPPNDSLEVNERVAVEVERLKAIVNMLPKTADGVPAVPHWTTRLWYKHPDSGVIYERTFEADMEDARSHRVGGNCVWVSVRECYSTRESAEKGVE